MMVVFAHHSRVELAINLLNDGKLLGRNGAFVNNRAVDDMKVFIAKKKCRFNLFNRPTLLFGQVQDVRFSRSISWTGNSQLEEVEWECRTNLQACQCLKVVMILFRAKWQTHILQASDTTFHQPTILWNTFVASTQHNSSVSESVKWFGQTNSSWECTAVDISSVELRCPT